MAKFEVGDKVVEEGNLEFLFNPYWKKGKRKILIQTVTEADEELFTIYNDKGRCDTTLQNALLCGANEYLAFYQGSGRCRCWCNRKRLLHLVHDRDRIKEIVRKLGETQYDKDLDSYRRQINDLNAMMKRTREIYEDDLKVNGELLGISL